MQFTIARGELLRELSLLQGVVEKKNTIPILSNVLIDTLNESRVSLVATDLDVSLTTECSADVNTAGAVVVQARKLFDIVRSLPDANISFFKDGNDWVKVACGASEFKVVGQAKEHFPSTPVSKEPGRLIPSSRLSRLIGRTIYSITQEESRYALNGALFVLGSGRLQMVATDGHRLALASTKLDDTDVGEQIKVIVPKKALSELLKLSAGVEEPTEFRMDENHLFFGIGRRQLTSRTLTGQFPNYELVMPKNNDKSVELNCEEVTQSIRRAALMADERSHGVKFELSKGKLSMTSQSADVGESRELVPVDYNGESVTIGFNAQYLVDFLTVVGTEKVLFEFKDEQSPALLKPLDEAEDEYRYVVMPMRLL
jgi:DNA polymerase III subunit beta